MTSSIVIIVVVAMMVGFMFLSTRKQKRLMENRYNMLTQLLPGDQVSTTAGLYGTVVKVTDTKIDLMIADGMVTTWDLNAIRGKVEDTPSELDSELEAAATAAEPAEGTATSEWIDANAPEFPDTIEGIDDLDKGGNGDTPSASPENSEK